MFFFPDIFYASFSCLLFYHTCPLFSIYPKVGNTVFVNKSYDDNNGSLRGIEYGNGYSENYTYDKYGNINKVFTKNSSTDEEQLAYEYVADNTGTVTKAIDHKNSLQYNYTYDSLGRLISSARTNRTNNSRVAMFEYDFDLNNNLTKFAVLTPNGSNVTSYEYGKDNLPETVTFSSGDTLTYNYDTLGRNNKVTINTTNPIEINYYYHSYTDENGTKHNSNLLGMESSEYFKYRYEFDCRNNITVVQDVTYDTDGNAVYTPIEEYTYDSLSQLKQVDYLTQNKRVVYTYDLGGNITKEKIYTLADDGTATLSSSNSYTYGDTSWSDKLTRYKGQTITYDSIGNPLTYRDGITFTWSNGRQLDSYTKDGETVNYTYDTNGMRLSKTVDGVKYTYLYEGGLLVQETRGSDIFDYSYDANGSLCMLSYSSTDDDEDEEPLIYYYALNSRGDVIGLYNANGVLIAKYTYDVWGNEVSITNASDVDISNINNIATAQPFRYRSYYYDAESNFYYLQSRYYDPVTHRFINSDKLYDTGTGVIGYNMYAYCNNNPVNCSDPSGMHACGDPTCILCRPEREQFVRNNFDWIISVNPYFVEDVTEELNKSMIINSLLLKNYSLNNTYEKTIKYFVDNVRSGGKWDFKSQYEWNLYPNKIYSYNGEIFRYDAIGNIHYGYVGRVIFSESVLLKGAGFAQILDGNASLFFIDSNFDDPLDQAAISYGCRLWDLGGLE